MMDIKKNKERKNILKDRKCSRYVYLQAKKMVIFDKNDRKAQKK